MKSRTNLLFFFFFLIPFSNANNLQITTKGVILQSGNAQINSPAEGLWSIATDWQTNWPDAWLHANPERVEAVGPWTIAYGTLKTPTGEWKVRDAYREQGNVVKVIRRYVWKGEKTTNKTTLAIRWQVSHSETAQVIMPSVLYNGNPSGAKTGFGLVPVYNGNDGEELIVEEHRFPMPFVSLEWNLRREDLGVAVHSLPSPAPFAQKPDQWWSMGVSKLPGITEIQLLSGPCSMNGTRSVVKANQAKYFPYNEAWLNVPSNGIIEKTFYLQAYPVHYEGSGFETAMDASLDIFKPTVSENMPSIADIIQNKYRLAQTRWYSNESVHGFTNFPIENKRKDISMGWVGQADLPGYALPVLSKYLNDATINEKAQKSLDFLTTAPFGENGFAVNFDYQNKSWARADFLAQGSAMNNFANAINASAKNKKMNISKWKSFLEKAALFHAERILNEKWNPVSTNEAFFIAPLLKAAKIFKSKKMELAAIKATEHYGERHFSMKEPYWGGTLDARAEDKEGAWAAFQGFLTAYEYNKDEKYLRWAKHACNIMLTYTVVWDMAMPAGRMTNHDFKTRGWTGVSVQNHHLDVFGVVTAPSVYRLGTYVNNKRYKDLALLMYRSCGQIIDPFGSQGEQVQQTNYLQHGRGKVETLENVRGGYYEDWTVFWITAHFLNGAAQFEEMGVKLE